MEALAQLLSDLVSINSINPDLVPGSPGEAEIAHYIARWLKRADLEVQLVESVTGRPNVVAIARGTGGGKTLLLNGHMDTVGVAGMSLPHEPVIKDGRLYGRGAYDMKGGLAACMSAIAEARKRQLRGDVIFTAVMDEEYASMGTEDLSGSRSRQPAEQLTGHARTSGWMRLLRWDESWSNWKNWIKNFVQIQPIACLGVAHYMHH